MYKYVIILRVTNISEINNLNNLNNLIIAVIADIESPIRTSHHVLNICYSVVRLILAALAITLSENIHGYFTRTMIWL